MFCCKNTVKRIFRQYNPFAAKIIVKRIISPNCNGQSTALVFGIVPPPYLCLLLPLCSREVVTRDTALPYHSARELIRDDVKYDITHVYRLTIFSAITIQKNQYRPRSCVI